MKVLRRRAAALFLALGVLAALAPGLFPAAQAKPASETRAGKAPYFISVNRATCTVTVYEAGEDGYYSRPVRAMVCSVGKKGLGYTKRGSFTLTGYRPLWCRMVDGSYGQYISQFYGDFLFHSVCYEKADPATLMTQEYNDLGSPASHGCVRLQTGDAKWIYDNCPAGTGVYIFDGDASMDPLGKPERLVEHIGEDHPNRGWDPTDPREENPWHAVLAQPEELAFPTVQTVEVDGTAVEFPCCTVKDENGDDMNYVRVRDLAAALAGSAGRFSVRWEDGVVLTGDGTYVPNGSEFSVPFSEPHPYTRLSEATVVDGRAEELDAIFLEDEAGGGFTYYRLRSLGMALGFNVGWDGERGVFLETGKPYDPTN